VPAHSSYLEKLWQTAEKVVAKPLAAICLQARDEIDSHLKCLVNLNIEKAQHGEGAESEKLNEKTRKTQLINN
jgi:hypothetical protein